MSEIRSILWRTGLTMSALVLLASCGIEQSTFMPPSPTQDVSTASPPPAKEPVLTSPPPLAATPLPPSMPSPTIPSRAPALTPTNSNQTATARQTVTLADEGKTITLHFGDQLLFALSNQYSWQLKFSDQSILRQVPNTGTKDDQGLFEASKPGSTTLAATGTPLCLNTVPRCLIPSRLFTLHINVPALASPGLTVTFADDGKTIPLAVGQSFLLSLGQDFEWTVTVDNPNVVSRVANVTVVKGAQGVYQAKGTGTTTLHATGIAVCPPGQACMQIALAFKVQLVVR